jgi:hypothetical protein
VVWRAVESAYHPHFGIWGGGVGAQRVHGRCEHLRRFLLILEMHTFVSIADSATHRLDAVAKISPRSAVRTVRALTSTADAFLRIVLILELMEPYAASDLSLREPEFIRGFCSRCQRGTA